MLTEVIIVFGQGALGIEDVVPHVVNEGDGVCACLGSIIKCSGHSDNEFGADDVVIQVTLAQVDEGLEVRGDGLATNLEASALNGDGDHSCT